MNLMTHSYPLFWETIGLTMSLLVLLSGCDMGAAQKAVDSVGVIVELDPIETTITGQVLDASTEEFVETPVTLRFKGPGGTEVVDMYSDPLSTQTIQGGLTSFGLRNTRTPTSNDPVKLRVVAEADDYQTTSTNVEIHETGTKRFSLSMLAENPSDQPTGSAGVRDQSSTTDEEGRIEQDLNIETPDVQEQGRVHLYVPEGSRLGAAKASGGGQLAVDLTYYAPTEETLSSLPGDGLLADGGGNARFNLAGYMNLQMYSGEQTVKTVQSPSSDTAEVTARLPSDAVHPATGEELQEEDVLELYRYDTRDGTWHTDTTVTVRALGAASSKTEPAALEASSERNGFGVSWSPWEGKKTSEWWAWGARSQSTCPFGARVQVDPNDQSGEVQIALRRSGLQYQETLDVADLGEEERLSEVLAQSEGAHHDDYALVLKTSDGTKKLEEVDPCSGTYTTALPAPSADARTDVLFRGTPECPGDQKVRITSVPTLTLYYREESASSGTSWKTASDDRITWVMDDPDNPTYIERAELRLDGLKEETRYQMYTTYDGERYEASALVPDRDKATIEEERVLVEYSQDFSDVCS